MAVLGFLTNKEAQEQIATLTARIGTLESEAAAADEALTVARADLATANESLTQARERITQLEAGGNTDLTAAQERITTLEAQVTADAAKITDLTIKATHTENKVKLEAARMLAATGHTQVELAPDIIGEASQTPHLDKFESLTGADATAYFAEHKAAIKREQTRKAKAAK